MLRTALLTLALAALAGCSSTPYRTDHDYDPQADFASYRSFAWISENPMVIAPGSQGQPNPLLESRVMREIEQELRARGYEQVEDPAEADFVVAFTVGSREKVDVRSYPTPVGYGGGWYGPRGWGAPYYTSDVDVRQYTEGTLAIDIFDVESRRPVWHGRATGNVRDRDREERARIIAEAVVSILATFPPM